MAKKSLVLYFLLVSLQNNCGFLTKQQFYGFYPQNFKSVNKEPICKEDNNTATQKELPQCATSVEGLLDGLVIDGTTYREELLPPWIDLDLAIKGQQFAMDHITSVAISYFYGLTLILTVPQGSEILLHTEKSDTEPKATRRYAATIVQIFLWMRRALSKDPKDNWVFQSMSNVRFIHQRAALRAKAAFATNKTLGLQEKFGKVKVNERLWAAFHADLVNSNIPLEQRIMPEALVKQSGDNLTHPFSQFIFALTQWAFLGPGITRYKELLMADATEEQLLAYCHLWAVVGYAMGIDDKFNIALKPDFKSIKVYMEEILQKYFIPSLFNLTHGSKILLEAFLLGSSDIVIGMGPEWLLRGILKNMVGIPTPHMDARRDLYGLGADITMRQARVPTSLFPEWAPISSPILSLYHFHIGFRFFGQKYSSDENISKYCYYY